MYCLVLVLLNNRSFHINRTEGNRGASEKRRKKKQYYAKVIREEKAREEERAKKYRDRARERREIAANEDQLNLDLIFAFVLSFFFVEHEVISIK